MPTWLKTILAGGETALPSDTPSGRLDTAREFGFVGALAISNGGRASPGAFPRTRLQLEQAVADARLVAQH